MFRILCPFLAVFTLNPSLCSSYTLKTPLRASSCVSGHSDPLPSYTNTLRSARLSALSLRFHSTTFRYPGNHPLYASTRSAPASFLPATPSASLDSLARLLLPLSFLSDPVHPPPTYLLPYGCKIPTFQCNPYCVLNLFPTCSIQFLPCW